MHHAACPTVPAVGPSRLLSVEEEHRLIAAASPEMAKVIVVLLETGMRYGHLFHARWSHVSEDGELSGIYFGSPFVVKLTPRSLEALGPRGASDKPLVRGLKLNASVFNSNLRALAGRAGVRPKGLSSRCLRWTRVFRLKASGGSRKDCAGQVPNMCSEILSQVWPEPKPVRSAFLAGPAPPLEAPAAVPAPLQALLDQLKAAGLILGAPTRMRLVNAVRAWLEAKAVRAWCPKAAQNGRATWEAFLEVLGLERYVDEITGFDIERLFAASTGGPDYLNYKGSFLKNFFGWALRRGLIRTDPSEAWVRSAGESVRVHREVTAEEEAKLCAVAPAPIARYVAVAIATGLRRSTLYRARWQWVSADWVLHVPCSALKNRKAIRIPLNRRAVKALGKRRSTGPLLPGLPHMDLIGKALRYWARKAGVNPKDLASHQFRKTWVARLVAAGASATEIQRIQNWSSSNVMIRHYFAPVTVDRARELMERL